MEYIDILVYTACVGIVLGVFLIAAVPLIDRFRR